MNMRRIIAGILLLCLPLVAGARTYRLEGMVGGKYPVVIELEQHDDGLFSGRYAYKSTLKNNGNVDCSWLQINPSYENPTTQWTVRDCRMNPVETWYNVKFDGARRLTCRMKNVPGKVYDIVAQAATSGGGNSSANGAAARRYKAKYEEVNIADIHLLRADGKKIWYNPWTHETESGYVNKLYVYDSATDRETVVNLNKTSMEDSEMWVEDMVERNGVITVIMSERRNSNGWVEGTYVWQYDCYGNSWKAIARGCSGAEFVNNRTAVRINNAEILNPDAPTYLQKYRNHYRTVRL